MTAQSPTLQHIQSWLRQSDAEFEERIKEEEQKHKETPLEHRLPDPAHGWDIGYQRSIHERNMLPVGMFLDVIDQNKPNARRATPYQLMHVAEVGRDLLCAALAHPDATEEFLEEARGQCGGPLVDAALSEMSGSVWRRNQQTGEMNEEPAEYLLY